MLNVREDGIILEKINNNEEFFGEIKPCFICKKDFIVKKETLRMRYKGINLVPICLECVNK